MLIKCKATFLENISTQFGFYGPKGEPQRRIKDGQEFNYDYREGVDKIEERDGSHFIGSWIEVLELPKKKATRKKAKKVDPVDELELQESEI